MATYNPTLWSNVKTLFDYYRIPLQSASHYPSGVWDVLTAYNGFSEDINKGKGFRFPVKLEPSQGASPAGDDFFPGSYADSTHDILDYYATVEEEPTTFDLQDKEVLDILRQDLNDQPALIKHNFERMLFGSSTGKIAEVISKDGSGTFITIKPVYCDSTDYPGGADDLFVPGLRYDTYTGATPNTDVGVKVTSIDTTNHRLYGTWTDVTAGDYIYFHDSYNAEFSGLYDIIDKTTTTYGGINPSTYSVWKSYVLDLDGDDLTFKILKDFDSRYYHNNPTKKCTHVIAHPDTSSKYLELYFSKGNASVNIANGQEARPNMGSATPTYYSSYYKSNFPILETRMCPPGKMYFINANALHYKIRRAFDWLQGEPEFGGVFRHGAIAKEKILLALGWIRYSVFATLRNAHGAIININTATGS